MSDKCDRWERLEFRSIDLGDKRLDERFKITVEKLSQQPTSPINQACDSWSDTKAAYRLFDNEKVTIDRILQPHQQSTLGRLKAEDVVLAVQDTTFLNYPKNRSRIAKALHIFLELTAVFRIMTSTKRKRGWAASGVTRIKSTRG